jgi:Flp pilus assembly protein protease CpaA
MILLSIIIAFIVLIIGSITDFWRREVHDYVSYGLMAASIGVACAYSLAYWSISYIVHSLLGLIIGIIIGYLMFYLGQWGGGDSKIIMGLGAAIGFNAFSILGQKNYWFLITLINTILFGAVYGLGWSIFLAIKHRKDFVKSLRNLGKQRNIIIARASLLGFTLISAVAIILFIRDELRMLLLIILAAILAVFYSWIFMKVIEESCMIKRVSADVLTEGDWINKDIYIGKRYIAGPKDLGISREQISLLKKYSKNGKIKKIEVKEGIPFIPAFLVGLLITMYWYYSGLGMIFF